jgi:thymidylate kinase
MDRTGKSTTRKTFAESTNQRYITFDRSFIDNLVYDEMFRNQVLNEWELFYVMARFFSLANVFLVRLNLDFKEINRRCKETEGTEYPMEELQKCSELFDKYFKEAEAFGFTTIVIECDGLTVEEIVKKIVYKVEHV